jgi:hypothetical protein
MAFSESCWKREGWLAEISWLAQALILGLAGFFCHPDSPITAAVFIGKI